MYTYKEIKTLITCMNRLSLVSVLHFMVFMYIVENTKVTSSQISKDTKIKPSHVRNILVDLKRKNLINSVDDENDNSNSKLRRQLYFANDEITKEVNTGIE